MTKIAVLVSGGGTNLQALIDAQQAGKIENGQISLVISSNPKAYALERAAKAAIPSEVLRRRDFSDAEEYGKALTALLENADIGLIVLAGFMTVLPDSFCRRLHLRRIRVAASTGDLFNISTIRRERGLDYPYSRTVNFTLNLTF